jgi:flagellar hook-associated protein 3 FlgL
MLNQQSRLNQTQLQMNAGKKILTPSDDPAAASRIIDLNQSIKQTEQYQSNNDAARQRLTLEDTVLQSATDILQQINELSIQGLSDTNSAARPTIAAEMRGLNQQLLGLANTKNANGEYLFSGFKSTTPPFSKDPITGAYSYDGDTNQRSIQIGVGETLKIADGDPGSNVFGMPTGGVPPGTIPNIFEAIDKFAADLSATPPISASLGDISSALNNIAAVRSSVGTRLNTLDNQQAFNTDHVLNTKTVLSATEDLDYAEAISRFNQQTLALQVSQQAFAQVKKLSLFNYL